MENKSNMPIGTEEIFQNQTDLETTQKTGKPIELSVLERSDMLVRLLSIEGKITQQGEAETREFAKDHVRIIRFPDSNFSDIAVINWEYFEDSNVPTSLKGIIGLDSTRAVVPEYFPSELKKSFFSSRMLGAIQLREWFRLKKLKSPQEIWSDELETPRLKFADGIETISKQNNKTIIVADIASKPAYVLAHQLPIITPSLASIVYMFTASSNMLPRDIFVGTMLNAITPYWHMMQKAAMKRGELQYDPEKIHHYYERLLIDFTDARRLVTAAGLRQLAGEYSNKLSTGDQEARGQIVTIYPKAHAIRICKALLEPTKGIKEELYKILGRGFGLSYDLRTYKYKGGKLDRLMRSGYRFGKPDVGQTKTTSSSENLYAWQLVSSKPIRFR